MTEIDLGLSIYTMYNETKNHHYFWYIMQYTTLDSPNIDMGTIIAEYYYK